MTKAFALAALNHPQMRSAYFSFPWGHIGEYASQIASVIMDRRVGDEDVILLAPLVAPEQQTLLALDAHLRRYQKEPVESIRAFREALRVTRLPGVIRRLLWWLTLHVVPSRRARHFGTFGVTTMSPFGAKTLTVPSLWTLFSIMASSARQARCRSGWPSTTASWTAPLSATRSWKWSKPCTTKLPPSYAAWRREPATPGPNRPERPSYSPLPSGGEGFLLPSPGTPGEGLGVRAYYASPSRGEEYQERGEKSPHPQPLSRSTGRGEENALTPEGARGKTVNGPAMKGEQS